MTRIKTILLTATFALIGVAALSNNAFAHDGHQHEQRAASVLNEEQKQRVEERKSVLQKRLTEAKEARQNSLEGKRLTTCENRSAKINKILSHGTDQSRKHLAVFQKIEERVKQFYANKNLSVSGYEAAVANADAKEAAAIAAIETSTSATFDCASADGAKPGAAVRELMKTRHQALKDYRTAVKELITLVKKSHPKSQNSANPTETEPTTREDQ